MKLCNTQGGPKLGIRYIVNYCIPIFGPPCIGRNIDHILQ